MSEGASATWTQSPAGTAFSTLYGRVQNYVLAPSDTDVATIAKEAVNEAILRMNTRRWTWTLTRQDVTFTASQQEYDLPTNYKTMRAIEIINSSSQITGSMPYVDPKNFDIAYSYRVGSGCPSTYTIFNEFLNGKVTLDYSPSASYIAVNPYMRYRYYRRLLTMTGDASLFEGPTECEPFLVWHGRATVAAHWSTDKALFAERRAMDLWQAIVRDDVRKEASDFL